MPFAFRPKFFQTFNTTFETSANGGLNLKVRGEEGNYVHASLTKKEAQELRDFLNKHITEGK